MEQYWKVMILSVVLFALLISYTIASGIPLVPQSIFNAALLPLLVGGGYTFYLILKRRFTKQKKSGISIEEAKFITANHLLHHHGINLFAAGKNHKDAKYLEHIISNRFFPSPGEERWTNRVIIKGDDRYFGGRETMIVLTVDGYGMVCDDPLMNASTFLNKDLWDNPGSDFMKGPSKTEKPRSLQDMIARHVEETGEIPEGALQSHVEPTMEKKEDKKIPGIWLCS